MRQVAFAILCLVASGCGKAGGIDTADVAGTVTMDGSPVEGVEVFFFNDKFEGYGKTDENGQYRLINGAAVGDNKVYMKRAFGSGGDDSSKIDTSIPGMDERQMQAMSDGQGKGKKKNASSFPPEYGDPNTTKLSFPVPIEGTETADFHL